MHNVFFGAATIQNIHTHRRIHHLIDSAPGGLYRSYTSDSNLVIYHLPPTHPFYIGNIYICVYIMHKSSYIYNTLTHIHIYIYMLECFQQLNQTTD